MVGEIEQLKTLPVSYYDYSYYSVYCQATCKECSLYVTLTSLLTMLCTTTQCWHGCCCCCLLRDLQIGARSAPVAAEQQ